MTQHTNDESQQSNATLYGLIAVIAAMLIVAVRYGWRYFQREQAEGFDADSVLCLWGALNAVLVGGSLSWFLSRRKRAGADDLSPGKMLLLTVGGWVGLTTAVVLGLGLVYVWWDTLTGGRANWTQWKPWLVVGMIVGGVMMMFISLLFVRTGVRS